MGAPNAHAHHRKEIVGASAFAWSPNSGPEAPGPKRGSRPAISAESASPRTARKSSFSAWHNPEQPAKTDIARAPVTGGPLTLLTHDHTSGWPLWGPRGQVAFSKRSKSTRWRWRVEVRTSALFYLSVMNANGGRVKAADQGRCLRSRILPGPLAPLRQTARGEFSEPQQELRRGRRSKERCSDAAKSAWGGRLRRCRPERGWTDRARLLWKRGICGRAGFGPRDRR